MENIDIAGGLLWFVAFLFSTTLHEAAHAWVAWKGGDSTAYLGGQVWLSPLPHIRREPIGMLVVPLFTALTRGWAIGWASTPYSPYWATYHPRRAALMSAAGPGGNLLLAIVSFGQLKAVLVAGIFVAPASARVEHLVDVPGGGMALGFTAQMLSIFLMLNLMLFFFNLIPLPPLDGASALGLLLPEAMALRLRNLAHSPGFSIFGLLIAWQVFPFIVRPLFHVVLWALHPSALYG